MARYPRPCSSADPQGRGTAERRNPRAFPGGDPTPDTGFSRNRSLPLLNNGTSMETQERGVPTVFVIPLIQFFVGCILFVALLYGQRDLVILTLLVLALVSGVRLWTRISLSGLRCHSTVD